MRRHQKMKAEHNGVLGQTGQETANELALMRSKLQATADRRRRADEKVQSHRQTLISWVEGVRQAYPRVPSSHEISGTSLGTCGGVSLGASTCSSGGFGVDEVARAVQFEGSSTRAASGMQGASTRSKLTCIHLDDETIDIETNDGAAAVAPGFSPFAQCASLAGTPVGRIINNGPRWNPISRVQGADPPTPLVLPDQASGRELALFGREMRKRSHQPKLRVLSR